MVSPSDVEALADLIRAASRALVFTGAGVSTSSGIPDYRGPQGVWKTRTPVYYQDFMASLDARNTYWQQKLEDFASFAAASPTPTHRALADLEGAGKLELLVTQNVDGLHRAAGSVRVVEVHGTNGAIECQHCGDRTAPALHFDRFADTGVAPDCDCGGPLKPATISFGQSLRRKDFEEAFAATERADLVLSLGSTLSVTPAADIPLAAAQRVPYAIVNQGPTDHDRLDLALRVEAVLDEVVPAAVAIAIE